MSDNIKLTPKERIVMELIMKLLAYFFVMFSMGMAMLYLNLKFPNQTGMPPFKILAFGLTYLFGFGAVMNMIDKYREPENG